MRKFIPLLFSLPVALFSSVIVYKLVATPNAGMAAMIILPMIISSCAFAYLIFSSLETKFDSQAYSKLLIPSTWSIQFTIFVISIVLLHLGALYIPKLFNGM